MCVRKRERERERVRVCERERWWGERGMRRERKGGEGRQRGRKKEKI